MTGPLDAVSGIIRKRKTVKVIARNGAASGRAGTDCELIDRLVEAAGWAPFHHPSHNAHRSDDREIIEPWRAYKLDRTACNKLVERIDAGDNAGIIPGMLCAADALINVTWLPDPDGEFKAPEFSPTDRNMEHIAATAAFIQNLLVAATAAGLATYWSSGGILRQDKYKRMLGIPDQEIVLGSVFLFPPENADCELRDGKLREKRSDYRSWSTWVKTTFF